MALIAPLTAQPEGSPEAFHNLQVPASMRGFVAHVLAAPFFLLRRRRIMQLVFGPERLPPGYATRAGGVLTLRPSHYRAATEDFAAVPSSLSRLVAGYEALNAPDAPPVHVLYGRGDRVLDYRLQGEGFAACVPATRLELVDGGHMLPLTQPGRCAAFIRRAAGLA
jgi:pimeloyl-ACP methyl ester carboxylesterase